MSIVVKEIALPEGKIESVWGGYDFDKDSLAVVAFDAEHSDMCVLWTVGPHVRMELEEAGLTPDEILTDPDSSGVWVWEGSGVWTPGPWEHPQDGDIELVGTYRQPTDAEWQAIKEGRCPWNDDEWILKEPSK